MKDHRHPISTWRQEGHICLWTFDAARAHRFAGWHFNADAAGCDSLLTLLSLFKESGEAVYRTVELQASLAIFQSRVAGEKHLQARCPQKLRLSYAPASDDCSIGEEAGLLVISFGPEFLREFSGSIGRVKSRGDLSIDGDFAIRCGRNGNKRGDLWFWWWLRG